MPGGQFHALGLVLRQVVFPQQVEEFQFVLAESFADMAFVFFAQRRQLGQQFPVMGFGRGGAGVVGVNRPLQPLGEVGARRVLRQHRG